MVNSNFARGSYDELISLNGATSIKDIISYLTPTLPQTRCNFDRKGRGEAVNVDLYGWDDEERVGVVQIRMAFRRSAKHFLSVRKTYVLCGFNENGQAFRHPIGAMAVRAAVNAGASPLEVVRAAQRWMWQVSQRQLEDGRRQGDVLIVPERALPKGTAVERGSEATLAETHVVRSERIVTVNDRLYAIRPQLIHLKAQHAPKSYPLADTPWFSVRVAREEPAWDFSARMGD